eukprot:g6236.t1
MSVAVILLISPFLHGTLAEKSTIDTCKEFKCDVGMIAYGDCHIDTGCTRRDCCHCLPSHPNASSALPVQVSVTGYMPYNASFFSAELCRALDVPRTALSPVLARPGPANSQTVLLNFSFLAAGGNTTKMALALVDVSQVNAMCDEDCPEVLGGLSLRAVEGWDCREHEAQRAQKKANKAALGASMITLSLCFYGLCCYWLRRREAKRRQMLMPGLGPPRGQFAQLANDIGVYGMEEEDDEEQIELEMMAENLEDSEFFNSQYSKRSEESALDEVSHASEYEESTPLRNGKTFGPTPGWSGPVGEKKSREQASGAGEEEEESGGWPGEVKRVRVEEKWRPIFDNDTPTAQHLRRESPVTRHSPDIDPEMGPGTAIDVKVSVPPPKPDLARERRRREAEDAGLGEDMHEHELAAEDLTASPDTAHWPNGHDTEADPVLHLPSLAQPIPKPTSPHKTQRSRSSTMSSSPSSSPEQRISPLRSRREAVSPSSGGAGGSGRAGSSVEQQARRARTDSGAAPGMNGHARSGRARQDSHESARPAQAASDVSPGKTKSVSKVETDRDHLGTGPDGDGLSDLEPSEDAREEQGSSERDSLLAQHDTWI